MELRRPEIDGTSTMMSAPDQDANGPALGASRVGAELRAARLRLGWSLTDVAQDLRIRLPFLEAIEDGRVADLPGAAYAVGFVRAYAGALGLDADEVACRFRAEAHEMNRKTELAFPAPVPERGVPAGAVVFLGVLLAAGAYAGWYKFSDSRHADTNVAAVPARLAPLAERPPPPSSTLSPQVASILPPPAPPDPPPSQPAPTPTSALAAPVPPSIPVPAPVAVTPPPPAPAPPPQPVETNRVVLRFKADTYVQVREKQGPVLLNRVMRAGETWPVPKEPGLLLTTGNAGGLELVVDGQTASSLGQTGVVRRDVPLEPEAIKMPPGTRPLPGATRPQ